MRITIKNVHAYTMNVYANMHKKERAPRNFTTMLNTDSLLRIATDAAISAGEAIMEVYTSPTANWEVERKADNSPLTLADRRSHAVIAPALEATGIPVLSEEGAHLPFETRKGWRRLWVVDPLDGTKEFIKRNGEFTVNIALVEDGVPILGVIYVPVTRDLYVGSPAGAFKNGQPIHAKAAEEPAAPKATEAPAALKPAAEKPAAPLSSATCRGDEYVVVASRSHLSTETQEYIDSLRAEHPDLEMVSAGSSLKLCLVAEGKADVYPRFAPTMEWDTAAGHAICRAAGCEVYRVEAAGADAAADNGFRNQLRNTPLLRPLIYNKPDLLNPWFIVK